MQDGGRKAGKAGGQQGGGGQSRNGLWKAERGRDTARRARVRQGGRGQAERAEGSRENVRRGKSGGREGHG